MEVDGRSCEHKESCQNLMEYHAETRKLDRRLCKVQWTDRKLTEVDGWSSSCMESLGMVPWPCGKLTECSLAGQKVGGKSRGCTEG